MLRRDCDYPRRCNYWVLGSIKIAYPNILSLLRELRDPHCVFGKCLPTGSWTVRHNDFKPAGCVKKNDSTWKKGRRPRKSDISSKIIYATHNEYAWEMRTCRGHILTSIILRSHGCTSGFYYYPEASCARFLLSSLLLLLLNLKVGRPTARSRESHMFRCKAATSGISSGSGNTPDMTLPETNTTPLKLRRQPMKKVHFKKWTMCRGSGNLLLGSFLSAN